MRKKDKEVKVNKKYNHAKIAKPIMKESQIHKGDDYYVKYKSICLSSDR